MKILSKYTLGTAQLGMHYGINNRSGRPEEQRAIEILEEAYLGGIRSIDTAMDYGTSEEVIGKWLDIYMHKDVYITTKLKSAVNQGIAIDRIGEYVEESVRHSLDRMKLCKISNFQIHDFRDIEYYGNSIYNALVRLQKEEKIGEIGCSIYDEAELNTFLNYDFDTIQVPGNVFHRKILDSNLLVSAKLKGVKVFVRSPFLQGLFFMKPENLPKELAALQDPLSLLAVSAKEMKCTILELALCYLRRNSNVDSIVFGVESLAQLNQVMSAGAVCDNLDISALAGEYTEIQLELVDPRFWRIIHE